MKMLLLVLSLFGFVRPQTVDSNMVTSTGTSSTYPPECVDILNGASDDSFPETSVAKSFNTFCPVYNEFADCLDRNRALLRNSSNPMFVVLVDYWDKTLLKKRMSEVCSLLRDVSSDIECFKKVSGLSACTTQTSVLPREIRSIEDLCRYMQQLHTCSADAASGLCPQSAIDFYTTFLYVFVPVLCPVPNHQPTLVSGGPDSVILACAEEIYPDMLRSIYNTMNGKTFTESGVSSQISRIIFESFGSICRNRTTFHQCVQSRFKPPFMATDALLEKILDHTKIKYSLDQLCELELSTEEDKCLEESSKGMLLCSLVLMQSASFYSENQTLDTQSPANNNTEVSSTDYICPLISVVNKCIGIQLRRCSPRLEETFANVIQQLIQPKCQAVDIPKQISANVFTSSLIMCGFPLGGEIVSQFQTFNRNSTGIETSRMVRDLVPVACGYVDFYSICIARELPKSFSIFDKILLELFDMTDAVRMKTVINSLCDKTKVIQENIECLKTNLPKSSSSCLEKEEYQTSLFNKYKNIFDIDIRTVREMCSPLKEIGLCEANLLSSCSQELATTTKTFVLELLRTDCGGVRTLTSGIRKNHPYPMLCILVFFLSIMCKTS